MSVASLVSSGPLLLAIPVAAAAGAVTFLSPCCLPLVPGYLAFITGMSGADGGASATAAVADTDVVAETGGTVVATGSPGGSSSPRSRRGLACWAHPCLASCSASAGRLASARPSARR